MSRPAAIRHSMNDKQSQAKQIDRRGLIEVLGATYAHAGSWRSPIQELIGRRIVDFDHLSDRQMFASEREAVNHVQAMALREAQQFLPLLRAAGQGRRRRLQLWAARNWDRFRRRSSGVLATAAIQSQQIDIYERIVAGRFDPIVQRLPDRIAIPAVLMVDTPVWILETADFPKKPAVLREDRISEVQYDDRSADVAFGFRALYQLAATRGTFLYDHADTEGQDRLDCPGSKVEAYVRQEAAEQALERFHAHVQRMLSLSTGGGILLPPPPSTQPILALPEAPWEEQVVEAIDTFQDDEQDEEMLKNIRTRITGLLGRKPAPVAESVEVASMIDEAAFAAAITSPSAPETVAETPDAIIEPIEDTAAVATMIADQSVRTTPLQEFVASGMHIRTPPGQGDALVRQALRNAGIEGNASA